MKPTLYRTGMFAVCLTLSLGLDGCRLSSLQSQEGIGPVSAETVREQHITSDHAVRRTILNFKKRGLEFTMQRLGQVPLDSRARKSAEGGKRIFIEECSTPADLTAEEWRQVYPRWLREEIGIAPDAVIHAEEIRIHERQIWLFTCFSANRKTEDKETLFLKAYLLPQERTALTFRSSGWTMRDRTRFEKKMESLIAGLQTGD